MSRIQHKFYGDNSRDILRILSTCGIRMKGPQILSYLRESAKIILSIVVLIVATLEMSAGKDRLQTIFGPSYKQFAATDEASVAFICDWKAGNIGGSTVYDVDADAKTVNGHQAMITDQFIYFVMNAVEHSIDKKRNFLFTRDLKPTFGIHLAGAKRRCTRTYTFQS